MKCLSKGRNAAKPEKKKFAVKMEAMYSDVNTDGMLIQFTLACCFIGVSENAFTPLLLMVEKPHSHGKNVSFS